MSPRARHERHEEAPEVADAGNGTATPEDAGTAAPPSPRLTIQSVPEELPGATAFARYDDLHGASELVEIVPEFPDLHGPLRAATAYASDSGPGRMAGDWALVLIGWVKSGATDLKPWWQRQRVEFWESCGFASRPSYPTLYRRLTEIAERGGAQAFDEATGRLIQNARSQDARVGAWWHLDCTLAETHAALEHDCRAGEGCGRSRRRNSRPERVTGEEATRIRKEDAERPWAEVIGDRIDVRREDMGDGTYRYHGRNHIWRTRDPEAGLRMYRSAGRRDRVVFGYYNAALVDHYTGGVLVNHVFPADRVEADAFDQVYELGTARTGADPLSLAADRGFAVPPVFEHLTRRGVGAVLPYRRRNQNAPVRATATEHFDEHGVPRCRHCGESTDYVWAGLRVRNGREHPVIQFRCVAPQTDGCERLQTISPSHDFTRLLLLWRTHPAYVEMRQSQQQYERVHRLNRDRHGVAEKTYARRPKVVGRERHLAKVWIQLRASVGAMVEWLQICLINGWIEDPRTGSSEARNRGTEPQARADLAARRARRRGAGLRRLFRRREDEGRTGGRVARERDRSAPARAPNANAPP